MFFTKKNPKFVIRIVFRGIFKMIHHHKTDFPFSYRLLGWNGLLPSSSPSRDGAAVTPNRHRFYSPPLVQTTTDHRGLPSSQPAPTSDLHSIHSTSPFPHSRVLSVFGRWQQKNGGRRLPTTRYERPAATAAAKKRFFHSLKILNWIL